MPDHLKVDAPSQLTTAGSLEETSAVATGKSQRRSRKARPSSSGPMAELSELNLRRKAAHALFSSGLGSRERVRGLIPAIQALQAQRANASSSLIKPAEPTEAAQTLSEPSSESHQTFDERAFSVAARTARLATLLEAKYYDEPPSFKLAQIGETFWTAASDSLIKSTAPGVAQAASDTTTALAWYGITKATGMLAGARPHPAAGSATAVEQAVGGTVAAATSGTMGAGPVEQAPDGLSTRSIVTSLVTNTLGNTVYEGTRAALYNVIDQVRASRRPRTELDPYASKVQVHITLMDETKDYIAQELDPLTQGKIRGIDAQIIQCLNNPANGMRGLTQAERLMMRRETLVGSKMVTLHDSEWLKSPELRESLDELADFFPDSSADELKSVFFDKLGVESRPAVFLGGRGGVGKTQFIKNFAATVQRPIVETTLEELLSPQFWGPPGDWSQQALDEPELKTAAGILHAKKMETGRNDVVIVVNEADFGDEERCAKVDAIKRTMDSDNFKQYVNGGANHDIDAIFIFTSNVRNNSIEALCRRIPEVTMKSEERQRVSWAEEVFSQEVAALEKTHPPAFVEQVRSQVRRDMDFIRQVGNATQCGISITGTVVRTRFRSAVRDCGRGQAITTERAQAAILSVFRSNLGSIAYKALDAFGTGGTGGLTNLPTRQRSQSL